jgi:hypothetical protein
MSICDVAYSMDVLREFYLALYAGTFPPMASCPLCRMDIGALCDVRAAFKCPICLEQKDEGTVLVPCGHPLCKGCAQGLVQRSESTPLDFRQEVERVAVPPPSPRDALMDAVEQALFNDLGGDEAVAESIWQPTQPASPPPLVREETLPLAREELPNPLPEGLSPFWPADYTFLHDGQRVMWLLSYNHSRWFLYSCDPPYPYAWSGRTPWVPRGYAAYWYRPNRGSGRWMMAETR